MAATRGWTIESVTGRSAMMMEGKEKKEEL